MPTLGETVYYDNSARNNGNPSFSAAPWAGNTAYGDTMITKDQYIAGLQSQLKADPNAWSFYGGQRHNVSDMLAEATANSGQYAPGYVDPSLAAFNPNASTPSASNFTPQAQTTANASQAELNKNLATAGPLAQSATSAASTAPVANGVGTTVATQNAGLPTLANGQQAGGFNPQTQLGGLQMPSTSAPGLQIPAGQENFVYDPTTGKQVSPAEAAFNAAQAAGTKLSDNPATATKAAADAINQATPSAGPNIGLVNTTLANDPTYQKLLQDAQTAQSTATQSQSLQQQYQQLLTQFNIPGIDTTLVNDQAIINGTENDIRNEVQAAGGFATDSQVLGLATARNKTIIANYNQLLQTKTDAMSQINTMIGLAGQDRTYAQQQANNQLQIDTQLADYTQKFQANAQQAYNNVISAVGYSGLYQALQSDPASLSLAEQSLGLQPGELQGLATNESNKQNLANQLQQTQLAQANQNLQLTAAEEPLKVKQLQAQINSSNASAASSAASTAKTNAETAFENAHGGMTQADYTAQQQKQADAENAQIQTFQKDAGTFITQLDAGKITWGAAWNALHAQYPQASTETIDNALDATNYRNSAHGG